MDNHFLLNIYRKIRYNFLQRHVYGITATIRTLPDFIVIGAKRCGTTSIYQYLENHPCIKKSSHDHIGFFDDNFSLGELFYRSFFPTLYEKRRIETKHGKCLTYDVTSTYIQSSKSAQNIFSMIPNVKLIAILRNPIDRAYSEYNLNAKSDNNIKSFEYYVENELKEIKKEDQMFENKYTFDKQKKNYLRRGFYFEQLKPWFDLFSGENLLVISTEDLGSNSNEIFHKIFRFLEIPDYKIDNKKRYEKGQYSKLDDKLREKLIEFYKPMNEKLFNLIGERYNWNE